MVYWRRRKWIEHGRYGTMTDEMFFSEDEKSLRRGNRVAPRTQTCRPCLVWLEDAAANRHEGVILDLNPHGMCVRALAELPEGATLMVQLMRDEQYRQPLALPKRGAIVRRDSTGDGMIDYGIRLIHAPIPRAESAPIEISDTPPQPVRQSRMHTLDITVGDGPGNRNGR